ncbi:MAG: 3'-5' exonuclease domain-containing protein 2, partial [Flammeovirgaceae bacterium]
MTNDGKVNITHEEITNLPLGAYKGEITIISEASKLDGIFNAINKHKVVGFDTETKPVFVRGQSNKVGLMQIATHDKVFLIRLNRTGLVQPIIDFLENENILKAG